ALPPARDAARRISVSVIRSISRSPLLSLSLGPFEFGPRNHSQRDLAVHEPRSAVFLVGSLLDLLETWIAGADQFLRLVNLSRIHRNRARNFLSSGHKSALVLHWLRAFDG